MPRFFFHLRHGASVQKDMHGFLCSDLQAAGDVAEHCMKEMLAEGDQEIGQHAVEIADANGTVLATIQLGRTDRP
jgi:predicted  nucleic acid-binding Zn ribbon protein